jgi:hypothetical protein
VGNDAVRRVDLLGLEIKKYQGDPMNHPVNPADPAEIGRIDGNHGGGVTKVQFPIEISIAPNTKFGKTINVNGSVEITALYSNAISNVDEVIRHEREHVAINARINDRRAERLNKFDKLKVCYPCGPLAVKYIKIKHDYYVAWALAENLEFDIKEYDSPENNNRLANARNVMSQKATEATAAYANFQDCLKNPKKYK